MSETIQKRCMSCSSYSYYELENGLCRACNNRIKEFNSKKQLALQVKFKKIDPSAKIPTRNHKNDAGIDIYTNIQVPIFMNPGMVIKFTTGIQSEIPEGYCILIWDRSGLGSRGLNKCAGVIDCGYRNEWLVCMANNSQFSITINPGDRIAQGILTKLIDYDIVEVEELSDSERGEKGFGSSGA